MGIDEKDIVELKGYCPFMCFELALMQVSWAVLESAGKPLPKTYGTNCFDRCIEDKCAIWNKDKKRCGLVVGK